MSARPPITFLERLSDVDISAPADGEGLIFNAGLVKWTNVAIPGGELDTLSDVLIGSPANNQVLMYSTASSKWINYGPLAFTDILGNVAVEQLASGSGADATTFFRGDNTWVSPPIGTIPVTNDVLVGDNGGNAVASNLLIAHNGDNTVWVSKAINSGDTVLKVQNVGTSGGATSSLMCSGLTIDPGLQLRYYEGAYPTTGIIQNSDASLGSGFGRLIISGKNYIIFGNDGLAFAVERARIGNGIMAGTTIDRGIGTVNVADGYYVDGVKVGGVATITATVDQTAVTETAHATYTVPANTVAIGTTFRIVLWGNMDNGTTAITFTPRIRWGGTAGTQLIANPLTASTTTAGTDRRWKYEGYVTIRTIGASGTAVCQLSKAEHTTNGLGAITLDDGNSGTTAVTIDTTANKDLVFTWTLSSTTGTPHVRTIGGTIEAIQP